MDYYAFGCEAYPYNRILVFPEIEESNWMGGERLEDDFPLPLLFELDPDCPGVMREMYVSRMPLLRDDLLAAIQAAGVDNLQTYPAIIRDPATGEEHTNYKAVNIVGAVSALDRTAADIEPDFPIGEPAMLLNTAPLDESRGEGTLLFRLAENVSMIVIHDRVKRDLQARGFANLTFTDPAEWSG